MISEKIDFMRMVLGYSFLCCPYCKGHKFSGEQLRITDNETNRKYYYYDSIHCADCLTPYVTDGTYIWIKELD